MCLHRSSWLAQKSGRPSTRLHRRVKRVEAKPEPPWLLTLILTHILQTKVKSQVNPRKQAFAKIASLSKWFAIQEGHHGSVPDSHPGVPPPSRKCPQTWSQASDPSAGPPPPASKAQSPHSWGARALLGPMHALAPSARQAGTTDPSLRIRPSPVCNCRCSMRQPLVRHW